MPTVTVDDREIECETGANLRDVLREAGVSVYNGRASLLNCHGLGSCGTCAVAVDGEVSDKGIREKARLLTPPHHPNYDLRLSCQTKVLGDVEVEKYPGNWGTQIAEGPLPPVDEADDDPETSEAAAD